MTECSDWQLGERNPAVMLVNMSPDVNVAKKVKSLLVKEYIIEIHCIYKFFLCEFMKLHFKRKHPWNNSHRSQIDSALCT